MKSGIERVKFFNSVKIGKNEITYIDERNEEFLVDIDNILIKIQNIETKECTYTSLHNVVFFTLKK